MGDVEDIPTPEDMNLAGEIALLGEIATAEFRQKIVEQFSLDDQQVIHGMLLMLATVTDVLIHDVMRYGAHRLNAGAAATSTLHEIVRGLATGLCDTFPAEHRHGTWPLVTLKTHPHQLFGEEASDG
jgi:hypothetical protein